MQLSDMISAINRRVDDIIPQADAIEYLNAGLHEMEIATESSFPMLDGTTVTTFPFPERFHIIPVLYASVKFLQQNVMLDQANVYNQELQSQMQYFVEKYEVPAQYRDNNNCQQFTTQAGQLAYVITKNSYASMNANLKVYINNVLTEDWQLAQQVTVAPSAIVTTLTTTNDPRGFIFNPTTMINVDDTVTAEWDLHEDYDEPPYKWWNW